MWNCTMGIIFKKNGGLAASEVSVMQQAGMRDLQC